MIIDEEFEVGGTTTAVNGADPLWPACAGGRRVPRPRSQQRQLPRERFDPRDDTIDAQGRTRRTFKLGALQSISNIVESRRHPVDHRIGRLDNLTGCFVARRFRTGNVRFETRDRIA